MSQDDDDDDDDDDNDDDNNDDVRWTRWIVSSTRCHVRASHARVSSTWYEKERLTWPWRPLQSVISATKSNYDYCSRRPNDTVTQNTHYNVQCSNNIHAARRKVHGKVISELIQNAIVATMPVSSPCFLSKLDADLNCLLHTAVLLVFSARCLRRTNRRAIAMMFVRLSVCLGRACIVIIRCTRLQRRFKFTVGYSNVLETLTPKHVYLPTATVFFQFHPEQRWRMDVQTRLWRRYW